MRPGTPLGRLGIWTADLDELPHPQADQAAAAIEELGFGTLWFGEAGGRDALTQAAFVLSATRRIMVATGIANIYLRRAYAMAAAERSLAEAFPGRLVLGLGGHVSRDQHVPPGFEHLARPDSQGPLADVNAYLDAMDAAPFRGVAPAEPARRMLAAIGPRMLELAAKRTWGAHPYMVPVEHTEKARERLGPDAVLAVEQAVVLSTAPDRARETARRHVGAYLALARHQQLNVRRLGFGDADLADGGSDRLVDALVAHGDLDRIAERVRDHLDAGADHVCLQVLLPEPGRIPYPEWRELAGLLPDLGSEPGSGPVS